MSSKFWALTIYSSNAGNAEKTACAFAAPFRGSDIEPARLKPEDDLPPVDGEARKPGPMCRNIR